MRVDREGTDVAAELARLKRVGSAILVRDRGAGRGICTALQGSEDEPRHRVLVRTAEADVLPVPPSGASIVDATPCDVRAASACGVDAYDPAAVERHVEAPGDVTAVSEAVTAVVDRAVDERTRPGELRVCLGRLSPFLTHHDVDTVSSAVGESMDCVREHAGMGHAHISTSPPDAVERVFDVTVETRLSPTGSHEQRWHLHGAGIDTGWVEV